MRSSSSFIGTDPIAAIEADSFEHAAIKTHELGIYPARVTREESRKSSLHYVEKTSPARTQPGPMATSPLFCQSVSAHDHLTRSSFVRHRPGFPDGYRARYAASGK
jgi:hypothetical protein